VLHHICIIRADLPLGVQLAQTIHAAGESSPGNLPEHTHAIALHAKDEQELLDLEKKLIEAKIDFKAIREPDMPWNGQLMTIGIKAQKRTSKIRKLLWNLKLAR
jgi:7-keto-8-aminopelargonate synthetase-like enzyme